jgi:hypothetical protein
VSTENAVALRGAAGRVVDDEFVAAVADDDALTKLLTELADLDAELAPRRAQLVVSG